MAERKRLAGFQKPLRTTKRREVKVGVISYHDIAAGASVTCSCGWSCWHGRAKVVEDRIDAHLAKAHGGMGMRL